MSDEGEKTCPLCAEEMDLTDQQLKPCKCGYEICVWCWHHVMDMAEKDETEGRCPACRTPYNKEKIVGTSTNCERLVSEIGVEKKHKSSKGKNKSLEGRKQLASVRVIQRNLVYVVGLPLNFADEDLLQRQEYFGQYGKVLKVSISRTASGAIQHFANSTCSVYITFSKEDEAVRCIQSVHGFVLDGKPLRACFGTTKYCHAWLRNVPCSNPDCLYLHEIGSQEDSFTKDEIVSAYTRSRVQQITGYSNSTQRHSGNVLPPPAHEYCNDTSASSGKPISKTAADSNNSAISARVSPPNSSYGRSATLPAGASWGARASSNQPLHTSTHCSNGPLKKLEMCNLPVPCSTAAVSQCQHDPGKTLVPNEENIISQSKSGTEASKPLERESSADQRITFYESSLASVHPVTLPVNRKSHDTLTTKLPPNGPNIVESSLACSELTSAKDSINATNKNVENICSDILSMSIPDNQILNVCDQHIKQTETSQTSGTNANTSVEVGFREVQSDFRLGMLSQLPQVHLHVEEDDLLSFHSQMLTIPEVTTNATPDFVHASRLSRYSNINSQYSVSDASISSHLDRQDVDKSGSIPTGPLTENTVKTPEVNNIRDSNLFPDEEKRSLLGRYDGEVGSDAFDMGESSIISNILSIDFDPWDELLTSPQNLAKMLGENDKQQPFAVPGSRKIKKSKQSRFSFAREEEPISQLYDFGKSNDYHTRGFNQRPFGNELSNNNGLHLDKFDGRYGLPFFNGTESEIFTGSQSHISSNRLTGNHLLDNSSLSRHQYQTPSSGNTVSNSDIEFMDPAILAVGKGTLPGSIVGSGADLRSSYSSELDAHKESTFQSFLQRSIPSHQNQRLIDLGESFSSLRDVYDIPSRVMEQPLSNNISPFSQFTISQSRNGIISNGQWNSWNEVQAGNNLGVAELLRTERLGKFYGGYEDSKIKIPSSAHLFNGTYGI